MRQRSAKRFAALVAGALVTGGAAAQVELDRLEVTVWPEYDQSAAVLVILNAKLTEGTALPTIVPLPMPTAAGSPHAVAKQAPNGNLLVAQHSVETTGDWSTVKVLSDSPTVRLEYYVPLSVTGDQRRHRFHWPAGIPIGQLAYEVLHPTGATNMSVTPPADGLVEADGLTFYRAELGALTAGEPFTLTLAYAKQGLALSSPAAQAAPAAQEGEPVAAVEASARSLDWLPVALIALAAAIGAWLMFRRPRGSGTA